jgi:predicted permease
LEIVAEQIIILTIIGLVGFIGAKAKILTTEGNKSLSRLILKITLPLLIFTTFANTKLSFELLSGLPYVVGTAVLSIIILFGLGSFSAKLQRLNSENTALHRASTMFGNIAFLGFPILDAIFPGGEGLIYASIFQLTHDAIMWTFGLFILNKSVQNQSKESWKHIINPATVSLFTGLVFLFLPFQLPKILYEPLHGIGHSTIYLSMIYTGAILNKTNFKSVILNYRSYILCFNKLLLCPIIITFVFLFLSRFNLGIPHKAIICAIMQTAMPCMIIISVLAEELELNSKQSVENIFISSILSILTLPLIYFLADLILD